MSEQEYIESGAIEACVLGLATAGEVAEFELMKLHHPAVQAAANQFELQLEEQALAQAAPPPAWIKEKVMQQTVDAYSASTPVIPLQPVQQVPARPMWMRYAAAACVALMLGSVTFNFILSKRIKDLQQEVLLARNTVVKPPPAEENGQFAFMQNPAITPVAMYGSTDVRKGYSCTLFWDQKEGKAYLVIHNLYTPTNDKDYQLWALVDGKQPVSIGVISGVQPGKPIPLENVPNGAAGFAITLEKKGGSPTPTLEQMYVNGKIS